MVRPLKYDSGNLQEFSDADLDRLCYNLKVAYADQLNSNGNGYIYSGSGETSIGSASDTSSTQRTNTTVRIVNDGITQGYPSYPGIGSETDATYAYRQKRTVPSFPSASTMNTDGYVYYSNDEVVVANTAAHLYDEILSQTITDMRTGDEIGTYRISASTPTNGGAGTWTDKGTWFVDSTYSAGSTTYKLWLKRSLTTIPGTEVLPVGLDGDDLKQRPISKTDNIIANVLLPALTRRINDGDLQYTVITSTPGGVNRGAFTDTKQTGTTNTQSFSSPNYNSTSTPSGSATTQTTYYLNLA